VRKVSSEVAGAPGLEGAPLPSGGSPRAVRDELTIRLLIPDMSAGSIIGKNGAVIRAICDVSRTTVRLSPAENRIPGVLERLVSVSGSDASIKIALTSIFATLSADLRKCGWRGLREVVLR
jgi:hypothetical protein